MGTGFCLGHFFILPKWPITKRSSNSAAFNRFFDWKNDGSRRAFAANRQSQLVHASAWKPLGSVAGGNHGTSTGCRRSGKVPGTERCLCWRYWKMPRLVPRENDLHLPMADPDHGGGYDGLEKGRINHNQGAESTLAYLLTELIYARNTRQKDQSS